MQKDLSRFIKRKFSLARYCRLNSKRYAMSRERLDVFLVTEKEKPTITELSYIDIDANSLIANELSDKCVFCHASCVVSEKDYMVFLGTSRSGKSTISAYLSELGFSLFADDDSVLKYDTSEALPYPTLGNFRARSRFLDDSIDVKNSILEHIYNISDSEFKKIYDLETHLYREKSNNRKRKKLNFILIREYMTKKPHLEIANKIDFKTTKEFFRFITISKEKRDSNISKIMDLYSKSDVYFLTMGTPESTADLIFKRFS